MSDTKVVFLDVDGTITTYENVIPASAKRAIGQARSRGHKVFMCTGRSKAENPPELLAIGFDGMIGGNGAYVEVDDTVVMHGMIYGGELYRDDVNKVSFILSSYQDYLDAVEEFSDMKVGTWGGAGEASAFSVACDASLNAKEARAWPIFRRLA